MPPRTRKKAEDPTIVIGIDFGTTYSGVAWARSSKPDRISTVTRWNSQLHHNSDKEKTPTAISYNPDRSVSSWGYGIAGNETSVRWFKLHLLDKQDTPAYLRKSDQYIMTQQALSYIGKSAADVVADYLQQIWEHTLADIQKSLGRQMLEISKLKVVITLPAIWPMYAQARMRSAAEKAGILEARPAAGETVLSFISEPEAAALATMEDMSDRADVQKNDHFVVCDAGGGTVDLITYEVIKSNPMTVRESVKGDGKLCGATLLDEGFLHLLRAAVPKEIYDNMGSSVIRKLMNSDWENGIKPQFCDEGSPWQVQLPYTGVSFQQQEISLTNLQILSVYEPIMLQILELVSKQKQQVESQYKKAPKHVILVGGFGKSRYLYKLLREHMPNEVEVLQSSGERPWTAVCRGAVLKGLTQGGMTDTLSVAVKSRIARASFGTTYNITPWEAELHHASDRAWCPVQQEFLAVDQAKWFLEIGEPITTGKPICHKFWQDLATVDETITTEIVYSEATPPPKRCDKTVKPLCTVNWSEIPDFNNLPIWVNTKGDTYRTVYYEVKMVGDGAWLDFSIYFEGKKMASHNVHVEFSMSGTPVNTP